MAPWFVTRLLGTTACSASLSEAEPSSEGCTHAGMIHSGFCWVGDNKRMAENASSHLCADRLLGEGKQVGVRG